MSFDRSKQVIQVNKNKHRFRNVIDRKDDLRGVVLFDTREKPLNIGGFKSSISGIDGLNLFEDLQEINLDISVKSFLNLMFNEKATP